MLLRAVVLFLLIHAHPGHAQSLGADSSDATVVPSPVAVVSGNGLETRVLFVGLDMARHTLTLSVEITNIGPGSVYLALVGPAPRAVDSRGGTYKVEKLAGMAKCRHMSNSNIDDCIRNVRDYLPGTMFTLIPANATSLLTFELSTRSVAKDGLLSFTMNAALGRGSRPADDRHHEPDLEYVNIYLPAVPLR